MKKLVGTSIMFAMIVTFFACFYGCSSEVSISRDVPEELRDTAEFVKVCQDFGIDVPTSKDEFKRLWKSSFELATNGEYSDGTLTIAANRAANRWEEIVKRYGENVKFTE